MVVVVTEEGSGEEAWTGGFAAAAGVRSVAGVANAEETGAGMAAESAAGSRAEGAAGTAAGTGAATGTAQHVRV